MRGAAVCEYVLHGTGSNLYYEVFIYGRPSPFIRLTPDAPWYARTCCWLPRELSGACSSVPPESRPARMRVQGVAGPPASGNPEVSPASPASAMASPAAPASKHPHSAIGRLCMHRRLSQGPLLVGIIAFLRDLFLLASLLASGTFLVGLSFHQGPLLVGPGTFPCARRLVSCGCCDQPPKKLPKTRTMVASSPSPGTSSCWHHRFPQGSLLLGIIACLRDFS